MSGSILDTTADKIAADIMEETESYFYYYYSHEGWDEETKSNIVSDIRDIVYNNLTGFGLEVKYNEIDSDA